MPGTKTKPGVGHLARWGLLITATVTGAALVATSWASYRSVERASETLARGQGEAILQSARQLARGEGEPPTRQDLEGFLERQAEVGLRYVAFVGPRGRMVAEAGTRIGALPDGHRPPGGLEPDDRLVDLGPRFRMLARLPDPGRRPRPGRRPPRPDSGPADQPRRDQEPPPRRGRPPGPPRGGPTMVIEIEPLVADQLAGRALQNLRWSALTALALLLASGVFWRLLKQREQDARRLEQQRQLRALGEMSAVLAHEIRNPVTSLKGHAQLLAERLPAGGRERRNAERVVAEAERLEGLSADLLDFCRSGPLDRRPVDPVRLLRDAAGEIDTGVGLSCGAAPRSWPLDPARMRQVLANVLRNAVQASPADQPPEAAVTVEGDSLLYVVRDFGPGILAGGEERIFKPFFTTRVQGTGLGLGVARRIVEMHGGSIRAGNHPTGGARFEIRIPPQGTQA